MSSRLIRLAFSAALGAAVLSPAVGAAQTGTPSQAQQQQPQPPKVTAEPAKPFGKWALQCTVAEGGARSCLLNQVFVNSETKRQVLRLSVFRKKPDNTDALVIVAPLGSDLTRNPTFTVPGVSNATPSYRFCVRDGCYAEFPIAAQLLAEMRKGGSGQVTFQVFRAQNPATFAVSFEGFADGYAALLASQ